jgi:DNA-binding helix-hairpin-helix protein with protein kinase domain
VTAAQKSESAPLHDAWKASLARFKPTIEDLGRQAKGLAALVDGFKRKLAAEKRAAERAAWEAAEKARKEAAAKAAAADAANIEEQREADEARRLAQEAEKEAQLARRGAKDVKGLRTVTRHEIESHKGALHWIAANDQDALTAFIEDYVRRNHKSKQIDGVKVWQEQEAF